MTLDFVNGKKCRGKSLDIGSLNTDGQIPLVGREREIHLLRACARRGESTTTAVLIEGVAGVGKSALVERLVREQYTGEQRWVGFGRATQTMQNQPFYPLIEALSPNSGALTGLRAPGLVPFLPLPDAVSSLAGPGSTPLSMFGVAPDLRVQAIELLCEHVEKLVASNPATLVLEDLHAADAATIIALHELIDRLRGFPLFVVLTCRKVRTDTADLLDELHRLVHERLTLDALDPEAALHLVEQQLGGRVGARLASVLADAKGHPLLIRELLKSMVSDGALENRNGVVELQRTPAASTLVESVNLRIAQLDSEARRIVGAAAVLGTEFSLVELSDLLAQSIASLLPVLHAGESVGLLRLHDAVPRIAHDLVREAILNGLNAEERAALHLTAAENARRNGASAAKVLSHLEAAGSAEHELITKWRLEAANEANRREPIVAFRLYGQVLNDTASFTERWTMLQFRRVEAAASAGMLLEAEAIGDDLLANPLLSEQERFEAEWWMASIRFLRNNLSKCIERAESFASQTESDVLRARLLGMAALGHVASLSAGSGAAARHAVEVAERSNDPTARSLCLSVLSRQLANEGSLRDSLVVGLQAVEVASRDPQQLANRYQPHVFLTFTHLDLWDYSAARQTSRQARQLGDELGTVWSATFHAAQTAIVDFQEGHLGDALAEVEAGQHVARSTGTSMTGPWLAGIEGAICSFQSDWDRAKAATAFARQLLSEGQGSGIDFVVLAESLLIDREQAPQVQFSDAGLEHLLEAWDFIGALNADTLRSVLFIPIVVRCALLKRAQRFDELVGYASRLRSAGGISHLGFVAQLLDGIRTSAPDNVERAARDFLNSPRTLDAAELAFAAAQLLHSGGGFEEQSKDLCDLASDRFERCGALARVELTKSWRAAAFPTPPPRGGRPRRDSRKAGWDSLTATERVVAAAIAEGLSNRQMAARLGVSSRTVESHVSRILTKLGVSSRLHVALFALAAK